MATQNKRRGGAARQARRERALARLEANWPRILASALNFNVTLYLNRRVKEMNALRRNLGLEPRTDLRVA